MVSGRRDGGDDGGNAAGVVPVPVGQEQHIDARQVDGQPVGVVEPDLAVGTDVEEDRCRAVALADRGEGREAVTGDAELVDCDDAVVPVVLARRRTPEQVGHLRDLRDASTDT